MIHGPPCLAHLLRSALSTYNPDAPHGTAPGENDIGNILEAIGALLVNEAIEYNIDVATRRRRFEVSVLSSISSLITPYDMPGTAIMERSPPAT